ncbi:hypothetical protein SLEP1_g49771 [Rubroshorea leprosula]|uniref:Uncharacterized protein n=1 Tax=Rubroshorea leprosula TaxID=152421 RepID=A0AAV5LZ62_9ROSI|nr:hypothetical protein SLEP1_g49771 [Rubroshorea leprosula]
MTHLGFIRISAIIFDLLRPEGRMVGLFPRSKTWEAAAACQVKKVAPCFALLQYLRASTSRIESRWRKT